MLSQPCRKPWLQLETYGPVTYWTGGNIRAEGAWKYIKCAWNQRSNEINQGNFTYFWYISSRMSWLLCRTQRWSLLKYGMSDIHDIHESLEVWITKPAQSWLFEWFWVWRYRYTNRLQNGHGSSPCLPEKLGAVLSIHQVIQKQCTFVVPAPNTHNEGIKWGYNNTSAINYADRLWHQRAQTIVNTPVCDRVPGLVDIPFNFDGRISSLNRYVWSGASRLKAMPVEWARRR